MLAALVTSTSLVLVMAFFSSLLSGFLVYLYTWYCFPALFSLENKIQTIPLEAFFKSLETHIHVVDTVPAAQVLKTDLLVWTLTK